MKKTKEILLGITGSIAAYKSCEIINQLRKDGYSLTVVMSPEAKEFITPLSLQTLSGNKVYCEMFEPPDKWEPVHTSLADKARLILIAPATANVIGKLASGICESLLTSVVLASEAKVLIAPAMNEKMYKHAVVQENIEKLKRLGYKFIGPVKGHLACGYKGIGHIAPVEAIVKEAKRLCAS